MTHTISFFFPTPQVTFLQDQWAKVCVSAAADNLPVPAWDAWLASLIASVLTAWLVKYPLIPAPWPDKWYAPSVISNPLTVAETITFDDPTEALAAQYFAQYTAYCTLYVQTPEAQDLLLSALAQHEMLEYVALAFTAALPDLRNQMTPPPVHTTPASGATAVAAVTFPPPCHSPASTPTNPAVVPHFPYT